MLIECRLFHISFQAGWSKTKKIRKRKIRKIDFYHEVDLPSADVNRDLGKARSARGTIGLFGSTDNNIAKVFQE